jgi:hypothetical protein
MKNKILIFSAIILSTLVPLSAYAQDSQDYEIPEVRFINQQIRQGWDDYEIRPSTLATDGEWCRRVFLDIIGRVPSVAELREYVKDKDPAKKKKLVTQLLNDENYTEDYAKNWTTLWTNVLIGRSGGTERDSLTNRAGLQKYLRDSLARNKYYNEIVQELVTATGSNTPGTENYNGAVNFLTMKLAENATLATAETSRVFLGLQVQCTQCHNHPFNEWKQQKFWEMNAFFRQTRSLRRFSTGTRNISHVELVNESFTGEGLAKDPDKADIYYELRNGITKVAYPVFVDGTKINPSGYVEDVIRRDELGKLIVNSTYMDKMAVNRIWAHFMGYGFTKPIDDMGPHNPSSHPELVDYLGQQFRKKSFDLKQLITWVVLSEPYSLSSRTNSSNETVDDPQLGETPKFSRFYIRQMRAEELYESLITATSADQGRGSYEEQEKRKGQWLSQFIVAFGNDEGGEQTSFNGTIPQALMMFNGDLVKQATKKDSGSFLDQLAKSNLSNTQKINYLFEAAFARRPVKKEVEVANKLLVARQGELTAALQDIWWAVLNSNEFILNH